MAGLRVFQEAIPYFPDGVPCAAVRWRGLQVSQPAFSLNPRRTTACHPGSQTPRFAAGEWAGPGATPAVGYRAPCSHSEPPMTGLGIPTPTGDRVGGCLLSTPPAHGCSAYGQAPSPATKFVGAWGSRTSAAPGVGCGPGLPLDGRDIPIGDTSPRISAFLATCALGYPLLAEIPPQTPTNIYEVVNEPPTPSIPPAVLSGYCAPGYSVVPKNCANASCPYWPRVMSAIS